MIKRFLFLALFTIIFMWVYNILTSNVYHWFTTPGRLEEAFILAGELSILISIVILMRLIWHRNRLHLPDEPKRSWEKKNSYRLPGSKAVPESLTEEKNIYSSLFSLFICLLFLISAKVASQPPDNRFARAVEHEYYLSADIMLRISPKKNDVNEILRLTIVGNESEQSKMRKVEYLLRKGARPHSYRPGDEYAPLLQASLKHNRYLLPLLLKHSRTIWDGNTILRAPVRDGDEECVALLLRHGTELHVADAEGNAAIHYAVDPRHEDEQKALRIVRLLLQAGADINAVRLSSCPPFAHTPLDIAERNPDFPAMTEYLRTNGGKRAAELVTEYYNSQQ